MKLASLKEGRDGRLIVVSRDLSRYADAAASLQVALENWEEAGPELRSIAEALEAGKVEHHPFNPVECTAPLPRSYGWADGSAYVNHVELVRKARNAEMPQSFWTDALMYRGGSDRFLGPHDASRFADASWGIDFEAEVAVIVDDVPMGVSAEEARKKILLVLLVNDVSLRNLIPGELAKGFGFFQSKAPTAFSPVAVTPDELGTAWDGGTLNLPLLSYVNGKLFGKPNAKADMTFDFGKLIAHAARTRPLSAGMIVGSGTVSNKDADGGPGRRVEEGGVGYSCIAEIRAVETIRNGKPSTPFLAFGDSVKIEMLDMAGKSIFGAIDNKVEKA
ncbi:MAG: fumarylacetoacetate hydrolase family protein [Xanthobacteraceae bacterium]|nr:fumarylacetoacetate hydrolase family protein [Xanthobacteraceae bacterium]